MVTCPGRGHREWRGGTHTRVIGLKLERSPDADSNGRDLGVSTDDPSPTTARCRPPALRALARPHSPASGQRVVMKRVASGEPHPPVAELGPAPVSSATRRGAFAPPVPSPRDARGCNRPCGRPDSLFRDGESGPPRRTPGVALGTPRIRLSNSPALWLTLQRYGRRGHRMARRRSMPISRRRRLLRIAWLCAASRVRHCQ